MPFPGIQLRAEKPPHLELSTRAPQNEGWWRMKGVQIQHVGDIHPISQREASNDPISGRVGWWKAGETIPPPCRELCTYHQRSFTRKAPPGSPNGICHQQQPSTTLCHAEGCPSHCSGAVHSLSQPQSYPNGLMCVSMHGQKPHLSFLWACFGGVSRPHSQALLQPKVAISSLQQFGNTGNYSGVITRTPFEEFSSS